MQAKDIMTTKVVTVTPEARVEALAELMLAHRVSALPVVDHAGRLLGIVSEGDLMRRPETETERRRSWWLRLLAGSEGQARDYVKSHGHRAEDVMTRQVASVGEETPVGDIAQLLEKRRIKRVPVVRDGEVVGIVSRANLLQALAAHKTRMPSEPSPDDRAVRAEILKVLGREEWVTHGQLNVIVKEGTVELWGQVDSEDERKAVIVAVEGVTGVRAIEDHLALIAPYLRGA